MVRYMMVVLLLCGGVWARAEHPFDSERIPAGSLVILSQIAIRSYEQKEADWPEKRLLPIATAFYIADEPAKASNLFQRVVAKEPDNLFALLGWGATLMKLGRHEEAVPLLKRVWEQTHDVSALVNLARCYSKLNQWNALEALVPELIQYKYEDLNSVLGVLFNYSLLATNRSAARDAAVRALDGVPGECIAANPYLAIEVLAVLDRLEMPSQAEGIRTAIRLRDDNE
jgi:tetratricopeptide (TPR) repeat protein